MKKFFLSALAAVAIMFSACNSDETVNPEENTGSVKLAINFEEANSAGVRATPAMSKAIPVTSWSNIDRVRMFLYNPTDGTIKYSYEVDPATRADKTFPFGNIPVGNGYELLLVANARNAGSNHLFTSLDGTLFAEWGDYTVRDKKFNTQVLMDLKELDAAEYPVAHTIPAGVKLYHPIPEIFTAYQSNVNIQLGVTTPLGTAGLKREVAMMRVRIDKSIDFLNASYDGGAKVSFNHASNAIAVQVIPVGLGVKVGSFAGGISAPSNDNRIMIGALGATTFREGDPSSATHKNPGNAAPTIVDANFTLWQEVIVLPNATKQEVAGGLTASSNANENRRYQIIISAWAPKGYVTDKGVTLQAAAPIYWSGVIDGAFVENNIREVNITIKSSGDTEWPEVKKVGGLEITIGAPLDWNSEIQRTDIEI